MSIAVEAPTIVRLPQDVAHPQTLAALQFLSEQIMGRPLREIDVNIARDPSIFKPAYYASYDSTGAIAAAAAVHYVHSPDWHLDSLAASPRERGLGSQMLAHVEHEALALPYTRTLRLNPYPYDDMRLRGFYIRHGYVPSTVYRGRMYKILRSVTED